MALVRELTTEVSRHSAEAAELRTRLEITERAESSQREEGEITDFVYDEGQDLFRFPEDGRFAFSREWADMRLLEERGYFG